MRKRGLKLARDQACHRTDVVRHFIGHDHVIGAHAGHVGRIAQAPQLPKSHAHHHRLVDERGVDGVARQHGNASIGVRGGLDLPGRDRAKVKSVGKPEPRRDVRDHPNDLRRDHRIAAGEFQRPVIAIEVVNYCAEQKPPVLARVLAGVEAVEVDARIDESLDKAEVRSPAIAIEEISVARIEQVDDELYRLGARRSLVTVATRISGPLGERGDLRPVFGPPEPGRDNRLQGMKHRVDGRRRLYGRYPRIVPHRAKLGLGWIDLAVRILHYINNGRPGVRPQASNKGRL